MSCRRDGSQRRSVGGGEVGLACGDADTTAAAAAGSKLASTCLRTPAPRCCDVVRSSLMDFCFYSHASPAFIVITTIVSMVSVKKEKKVAHTRLPSVGFRS